MTIHFAEAIAAHLQWVQLFTAAAETGTLTESLDRSGYDDLCGFGMWLYSQDDAIKLTVDFRRVKDLHYRFHVEAALIASQLKAGHFERARQMLGGDFAEISSRLIHALRAWQDAGRSL
jgi:hypothetical protein